MADSLLPDDQSTLTEADIIAKWKDKPREELELAKAKSDLYIKTLEAKLDSVSKDYLDIKDQQQTGTQLKDLLDRLDNPNRQLAEHQPNVQTDTGIKPEDIEAMIARKLTDHQLSLKQSDNFNAMQTKLKETLGSDYASSYKQRLDTLGLTKEFADDLARNHPTVFMKTFGLDEQRQIPGSQTPPRSNVRHTSFAPSTQKRDWNYYQELKKTNPRMYLDPKLTLQMHDDAIALGADFGMPEA